MTGITEEMALLVAIGAVVLAAGIGFFVGRRSGTTRERVLELESEVSRQSEEIANYKQAVDGHFDKTASLFVSMAGSYKELFEHLSSGYDELSTGSTRELFRERVAALLPGAPGEAVVAADEAAQDAATAEAQAEGAGAATAEAAESPADTAVQESLQGEAAAAAAAAEAHAEPEAAGSATEATAPEVEADSGDASIQLGEADAPSEEATGGTAEEGRRETANSA